MPMGENASANKRTFAVAGVVLLVLAVLVALFAGGTFAKYVTEDDGEDSARVAKWGVEVYVADDWFKTAYGRDATDAGDIGDNTVQSSENDVNVVAPGTDGSFGEEPLNALNRWSVSPGNPKWRLK